MSVYNHFGINKNTYDLLSKDGIFLSKEEYGSPVSLFIILMLENSNNEKGKELIEEYKDKNYNFKISETGKHSFNIGDRCIIEFELMSEVFPELYQKMSKLPKNKDSSRCHLQSFLSALNLGSVRVLTGIIKLESHYFLHSVIEYDEEEPKIIDVPRNLILNKDDYMTLFEFNVLNEVESLELLKDMELIEKYDIPISSKLYLTFHDEFMQDLEKNKQLVR